MFKRTESYQPQAAAAGSAVHGGQGVFGEFSGSALHRTASIAICSMSSQQVFRWPGGERGAVIGGPEIRGDTRILPHHVSPRAARGLKLFLIGAIPIGVALAIVFGRGFGGGV